MNQSSLVAPLSSGDDRSCLFDNIAADIRQQGFSIRPDALPIELATDLYWYQRHLHGQQYQPAGIGRGQDFQRAERVRSDEICWINGSSDVGQRWLEWTSELKTHLNRQLFLGLFSFESHFAHYGPGDFYRRHVDAFRGSTNRVLSLVTYLNPVWQDADGGELVLYQNDADQDGVRVAPRMGTIAIFLSEEFPHEVLPAREDRYSIAGWFRVNSSIGGAIDPPR